MEIWPSRISCRLGQRAGCAAGPVADVSSCLSKDEEFGASGSNCLVLLGAGVRETSASNCFKRLKSSDLGIVSFLQHINHFGGEGLSVINRFFDTVHFRRVEIAQAGAGIVQ
ncbi:hypothetical protein CLV79_11517 [Limimaricola soesokkakensis]|uniref:Uncharacterized protein n=1 Tax=Limimaricola soesokkakensis TaxID=1343159 RepID=A0A1X7A0J3_9RHOB|nr:hypothetical protein CLV79_11517 [Limimaricola soesokkakensis]SLN67117.1 hypothetical protein LOS8367_03340 [Limimaricola soesokkakensis]